MQFPVVYPIETTLRTALRRAALYKLSWFERAPLGLCR